MNAAKNWEWKKCVGRRFVEVVEAAGQDLNPARKAIYEVGWI